MAKDSLPAPPVLSTPETHMLDILNVKSMLPEETASDEELYFKYEIQRTLSEIKRKTWRRVALQFPDEMLHESARVFQLLSQGRHARPRGDYKSAEKPSDTCLSVENTIEQTSDLSLKDEESSVNFTILADTSYGSCCVDEIAAEHVDADAIIHFGRACLSPTARLPVLHIFTRQPVDSDAVISCFKKCYPDFAADIILTADLPYSHSIEYIHQELLASGYHSLFAADVIHDPASPVPNRTVPEEVHNTPGKLKHWNLFHVSEPATSLLLTLASRVSQIHFYPTNGESEGSALADVSLLMRRRYALITSLATITTWGVLVNTLSVKSYLHVVNHVKAQIAAAGKKSYMFVVGKLNAAKVANFSEIGGWVIIGCWESSLVDSKDFYKPVITPFELELALRRDQDRIWTGDWSANFETILAEHKSDDPSSTIEPAGDQNVDSDATAARDFDSEDESLPPEFDLRTGRYVSQARPLQRMPAISLPSETANGTPNSFALTKRGTSTIATVNGVISPAAQFLHGQRTWKGLGSDLEVNYEETDSANSIGASLQIGRQGTARGYHHIGGHESHESRDSVQT